MERRRWIRVAAVVALAAVAGAWLLDRTLEGMLLTQVEAYLRARTLALVHSSDAGALSVELPHLNLSLIRRRLVLRDVRIRYQHEADHRTQQFAGAAPRITLTGVDLTDAIWHRKFRLSGVSIDDPILYHLDDAPPDSVPRPAGPSDTLPLTLPAADSLLYSVVANWLPDEVREGRIGIVRVNAATISSLKIRGPAVTVDSSARLSFTIRGLQLDSARHRIFERATLTLGYLVHARPGLEDSLVVRAAEVSISPDDTAFSIGELRTGPPSPRHGLRANGIRRSHARLMLTIDSVGWAPPVNDSAFFRLSPPRSTRVRMAMYGVRVLGLHQDNIRRRRLTAGGVWIARADLDVLADRRVSGPPGPGGRHRLWPARLAGLDWVVGTDSATIDSARIRYAEWPAGVSQPASVLFDQLHLRLLRATNDTAVAQGLPLVIQGRGRLLGEAPFTATIRVQVRTGPARLGMEGEVGSMPLRSFNSWSRPGNGVDITEGKLERTTFRFETANGRSSGELRAEWRDLNLRLVDPATGKQNLGKQLKSVVARMLTRNDNQANESGKVPAEKIDYEVRATDTFWGLIWRSLRSGLMNAVRN